MIIDATDLIMGRVAALSVKKALLGEDVVIINVEKAVISGTKENVIAKYKKGHRLRIFVTKDFDVYLSDLEHFKILTGNGLDWGDRLLDGYFFIDYTNPNETRFDWHRGGLEFLEIDFSEVESKKLINAIKSTASKFLRHD